MSVLRTEELKLPGVDMGEVSTLPSISENLRLSFMQDVFELGENDGLFVNYGMVDYAYPYKAQDNYSRRLCERTYKAVILENHHLRATFLPEFGGKLHSLYDKDAGRELLFSNSVVRPCHLGVRNAWMSGGVEWNFGYVGHNPFTCDRMHTASLQLDDGTPVLRFYQFERIRAMVYQMDFFLPEDSGMLMVRTRLVNPHFRVVPVYWWSNVAAPDSPGNRVIVPADTAFTARDMHPVKIRVPEYNGRDITYPLNNTISIDYFWNVPADERKYICQVDKDGYGLMQTSTRRLRGRKLFVWGDSEGGRRWKNFLTADDESGSYNEIQSGLAQTQYECIPMPPKTVWEWIEAYGPVALDPAKAHGDWNCARAEAARVLDARITEDRLEQLLKDTRGMAVRPAGKILFSADGWGALEEERRRVRGEDPMCPHLDFGVISDEQRPWLRLLQEGTLGEHDPADPPVSYICQEEWTGLLGEAAGGRDARNWFTWLQLGLSYFIAKDYERAKMMLEKSAELDPSPWAYYSLSILSRDKGDHGSEVRYMLEAVKLRPQDRSLVRAALRCLYENREMKSLKTLFESLASVLKTDPRCKAYYAFSLIDAGDLDKAAQILYSDGGLLVPDIRECETITLDLWYALEEAKAAAAGETFDRETALPPRFADFRMFADLDWLRGGEIIKE